MAACLRPAYGRGARSALRCCDVSAIRPHDADAERGAGTWRQAHQHQRRIEALASSPASPSPALPRRRRHRRRPLPRRPGRRSYRLATAVLLGTCQRHRTIRGQRSWTTALSAWAADVPALLRVSCRRRQPCPPYPSASRTQRGRPKRQCVVFASRDHLARRVGPALITAAAGQCINVTMAVGCRPTRGAR